MNLLEKIHDLKKLKLDLSELEKEIKDIEDTIKKEMTTRNVSELIVDVFKIRWKPFTTTRIDTTALKEELPEIAARYSKVTESHRLTIT
ncbi:MAG: hypothetical protein FWC89_09800 [Defluviitaleaceae bacterium]|nr:hypothetical protein [Defluviitaleaceae bacterium]